MLQNAAAATPEVGTARRDSIGRGLKNFDQLGFLNPAATPAARQGYPLARKRIGYEYTLPIDIRDTSTIMGQTHHRGFQNRSFGS
jgi:hypothetical protein